MLVEVSFLFPFNQTSLLLERHIRPLGELVQLNSLPRQTTIIDEGTCFWRFTATIQIGSQIAYQLWKVCVAPFRESVLIWMDLLFWCSHPHRAGKPSEGNISCPLSFDVSVPSCSDVLVNENNLTPYPPTPTKWEHHYRQTNTINTDWNSEFYTLLRW